MGEISRWLFFFYLVFLRMFVFPEIVNRSNQYVGVYSALVEVSRLVINWPSLTEQTYRTKRVINKKHLILHINWWFFRTAITLQNTVFGSVCQVHPLILRSKFANSFTNRRCSLYPSASFRCFLWYPMQSLLKWKVGFSSLYFIESRAKLDMEITFFAKYNLVGKMETNFCHYNDVHVKQHPRIAFCD